ncbi:MAG: response regulator [Oligoflexus sp.]
MSWNHFIHVLVALWTVVGAESGIGKNFEPQRIEYSEAIEGEFLGKYLYLTSFDQRTITAEEAWQRISSGDFELSSQQRPNYGLSRKAYFAYFEIENKSSEKLKLILENNFGMLDYFHLYKMDEFKNFHEVFSGGDQVDFSKRFVKARTINTQITLQPGINRFMLKTYGDTCLQIPIRLWKEGSYRDQIYFEQLFFGLLIGAHLIMIFYNAFLGFSLKDRIYLYYVLFVTFNLIYSISNFNLGQYFSWILFEIGVYSNHIQLFAVDFIIISGTLFSRRLLNINKKDFPLLSRLFSFNIFVSMFNLVVGNFMSAWHASLGTLINSSICIALFMTAGIIRFRSDYRPARYYLLAWGAYLFGSWAIVAVNFGLLEATHYNYWAQFVGGAIEVALFSLALGARINYIKKKNHEKIKFLTDNLKKEVKSKTKKLEIQRDKLMEQKKELVLAHETLQKHDMQKTRFFQNISHELRTPLTLILASLKSLVQRYPKDDDLDITERNSRRLLRLVNQLLDLQKLTQTEKKFSMSPVNIISFLQTCADYFRKACEVKNIRLALEGFEQSELRILAQVDALEKVIFNYLSNALKYTPQDGQITLGLSTEGSRLRLYVKDSGRGISAENQTRLFKIFSQIDDSEHQDFEGTGIGLALVKELVEKMNGVVGIESEPGKGCCFWAEFPLVDKAKIQVGNTLKTDEKSTYDLLIVDDDPNIINRLMTEIRSSTHIESIIVASSLKEAKQFLQDKRFKLVISDTNLENSESGGELLKFLQQIDSLTYHILLTTEQTPEHLNDVIDHCNIHHIFMKPFEVESLVETLTAAFDSSPLKNNFDDTSTENLSIKSWHLADYDIHPHISHDEEIEAGESNLGTVVVCDDVHDMRRLMKTCLRKAGFQVIGAADGKSGLAKIQELKPDLIVTDWMMPKLTGPELIRMLHEDEELRSIPTILLTAKSDEESKMIGTQVGATAYLSKPFDELELQMMAKNLVELKRSEKKIVELNRYLTEKVLCRFLPPQLVEQVVTGKLAIDETASTLPVTILFSDICGFTTLSEELGPQRISSILNHFLETMSRIIFEHHGTIDKFIGDAIMVIFGAPENISSSEQISLATRCARKMQEALGDLNQVWQEEGLQAFQMRIGIHHGPAVVGQFGSELRSEYTAIGPTVNYAARVQAHAEPGGIYISANVRDYLLDEWSVAGKFELKGIGEVNLFKLDPKLNKGENDAA